MEMGGKWGEGWGEGSERLASAALLSPQQSSARAMTTILVEAPYCLLFIRDLCFNLGIFFFRWSKQTLTAFIIATHSSGREVWAPKIRELYQAKFCIL